MAIVRTGVQERWPHHSKSIPSYPPCSSLLTETSPSANPLGLSCALGGWKLNNAPNRHPNWRSLIGEQQTWMQVKETEFKDNENRGSSQRPLFHTWALREGLRKTGMPAPPRGHQNKPQAAQFSTVLSHVKGSFSFDQNQSKTGSGDKQS